jgi:tetratricopeptide (TPR) repeat protein
VPGQATVRHTKRVTLKRDMGELSIKSRLSPEERAARRRLALEDTVALLTLLLAVVVLSVLTYLLVQSFKDHRQELAQRWARRGEAALAAHQPDLAVNLLRSALAYEPGRRTEIDLAEALAEAGRTQEAVAYFNTLLETEPGSGIINLQLARLAARQNDKARAVNYYQTALDGTWDSDGFDRRREVRLEMARYLIQIGDLNHARNELLIASSNSPNLPEVQLQIAGLLLQCKSPADALSIYRMVAQKRGGLWSAVAGAGQTAFDLGEFALAHGYLERAVADRSFRQQPAPVQTAVQQMLATTRQILAVFPSEDLPARERADRVLHDVNVARARFDGCDPAPAAATVQASPPIPLPPPPPSRSLLLLPGRNRAASAAAPVSATPPPQQAAASGQNQVLAAQWTQVPAKLTAYTLEQHPEMEQTLMQLVYDTEKDTALRCGQPQGEDALLLRIAQAPDLVEQR